jgi:hydroxylamine dehydrogenase
MPHGPDHSQIEIYEESKHRALFAAQREHMNLAADPKALTTRNMPVPTCATCHMSGLEGLKVTHDTTERLSWFLFAPCPRSGPATTGVKRR